MANIPSLGDSYLNTMPNHQHVLPTFDEDGNVNMIVEIPQGTFNKYEYVLEAGVIKLDRVHFETHPMPLEYGVIPQTWDEDNDLLDVMSFITHPTFPGCLIAARVIGIMKFKDSGETDDKIVCVPADDYRFDHVKSIKDIQENIVLELTHYWESYKDLQFRIHGQVEKSTKVEGWLDADEAMKVIQKCQEAYKLKFAKQ